MISNLARARCFHGGGSGRSVPADWQLEHVRLLLAAGDQRVHAFGVCQRQLNRGTDMFSTSVGHGVLHRADTGWRRSDLS